MPNDVVLYNKQEDYVEEQNNANFSPSLSLSLSSFHFFLLTYHDNIHDDGGDGYHYSQATVDNAGQSDQFQNSISVPGVELHYQTDRESEPEN